MANENRGQGQSTAVAVTEASIGRQLRDWLPTLAKYAVRKYDGENWVKSAMLCILESNDLQECLATSAGRASLYHALRYAATTGLSLNPQEGKAALVPIDGKVNYWVMKNGWVDLLMATGKVARAAAFTVYTEDAFVLVQTIDGDSYTFSPNLDDRCSIRGFVSAIRLTDGSASVHYMTLGQVEAHRDKYAKGLSNPKNAWKTSFEGRALAACQKQHIRRLALGVADVVEPDDETDARAGGGADWRDVSPGSSADDVEEKLRATRAEPVKPEPVPPPPPKPEPRPVTPTAPAKAEAVAVGAAEKAKVTEDGLF